MSVRISTARVIGSSPVKGSSESHARANENPLRVKT
jgi:hypothetical protein